MTQNSALFLLFVLCSVVLYYLIPKKLRKYVLLLASAVFYATYGAASCAFLLAAIVFTYFGGRLLGRIGEEEIPEGLSKEEKKQAKKRLTNKKRLCLAVLLLVNFGVLFALKYAGFTIGTIASLFGKSDFELPHLLVPLGISFYTFQSSGYLIDVERGKTAPEKSFLNYALFVGYFPQLVQGPINNYGEMRERLFFGNDYDPNNIRDGILRMMLGIIKKALVADALAPAVVEIYTNFEAYPGILAFIGAFLYCIQLYCDFSGGIDLVMGVSALYGVPMQENFARPFFAVSLGDFWRRWHISLGEWMKNYLFYPLALSKGMGKITKASKKLFSPDVSKRIVPCLATFVVFVAVGIWQGSGFANIFYGVWNGFWMSAGMLWVPVGTKLKKRLRLEDKNTLMTVLGVLRTTLLVIFGRYFSNSDTLAHAFGMIGRTFAHPEFAKLDYALLSSVGLSLDKFIPASAFLLVLLFIGVIEEGGEKFSEWFSRRNAVLQFILLFAALAFIVFGVYANSGYTPIAYVYENV